jgi:hypothetical protein
MSDPSNRLSSFEDVVDAFKKFPDGGFWVKKIIQRMGIFRETVVGPYTKKDADNLSERWKKVFKYEDEEVSKVMTFSDLVCSTSPSKLGEYKWKPPKGSGMICVVKGYYPLVVYTIDEVDQPEYRKFYEYTYPDGARSKKIGEMMIVYNRYNIDSYRRTTAMKQFIHRDMKSYDIDHQKWLIRKISGKKGLDEDKPNIIPGYISRLNWECSSIELDFFKEFLPSDSFPSEAKGKKKGKDGKKKGNSIITKAYNKLKRCASEDDKTFFFFQDVSFESVESDLLIEDKTLRNSDEISADRLLKIMKKIVIEKGSHGKYNILLTNHEGNFSVGVYAIEKGEGRMIINLPNSDFDPLKEKESMFISRNLRKRKYFTKMDVNGAILLYIVKCLGVKKVWIEDEKTGECECEASDVSSFVNPVRFLADQPSIYANLGFRNDQQEKLDQIIEEYRKVDLPVNDPWFNDPGEIQVGEQEYDSSSSSSSESEDGSSSSESEEEQETMNLADLAVMYLSRDCTYENLCDVMWIVTEDIYQKIPNKYWLDLEEVKLEYYRELF